MILGRDLQTLIVEMRERMTTIERSYLARFSPALSPSELSALRFLVRKGSPHMGDLAAGIGIPQSSATNLVDKLCRRGLVTRTRPATNRRVVTLQAQKKAMALISEIEAEQIALCDELVAGIAGENADLIRQLLEQLAKRNEH